MLKRNLLNFTFFVSQIFSVLTILFTLFLDLAFADESKIGVVLPLTGGASSNGESIYNSIILAEKFFDRNDRVKFIFEDDQLLPKKTVEAVNKLINVDSVNGLIVFGSPTSIAVSGIAENAKVPMISLSVVDVKDGDCILKGERTETGFTASPVSGCEDRLTSVRFAIKSEGLANYNYTYDISNLPELTCIGQSEAELQRVDT